jgi:hypothetical protein
MVCLVVGPVQSSALSIIPKLDKPGTYRLVRDFSPHPVHRCLHQLGLNGKLFLESMDIRPCDGGAGGTGSSTTKIMHFAYSSMPQYFIIDVLYRFPVNFYDYIGESVTKTLGKRTIKCVGIFAAKFPSSQV